MLMFLSDTDLSDPYLVSSLCSVGRAAPRRRRRVWV